MMAFDVGEDSTLEELRAAELRLVDEAGAVAEAAAEVVELLRSRGEDVDETLDDVSRLPF